MTTRRGRVVAVAGLLALLALLALPFGALAGGWAVATLDTSPVSVQPNVPFTVGFVVRQHGVTPIGGLSPKITFIDDATRERVRVTARPEGATGHYTASVTLLAEGLWTWEIDAFGMPQAMSPLRVSVPVAVATATPGRTLVPAVMVVVALVVVVSLGALAYSLTRARRTRLVARS